MRLIFCGLLVAFYSSLLCAQGKVDPAVRARLDRQFATGASATWRLFAELSLEETDTRAR